MATIAPESQHTGTLSEQFIQQQGNAPFRMILEIANEIVGFDRHRIYFNFPDTSKLIWSFHEDYYQGADLAASLERSLIYDKILLEAGRPCHQFVDPYGDRQLLLVRLRLRQGGTGYWGIARQRPEKFTRHEIYHLRMASRLLRAALADADALLLLHRLHLNFLHQRVQLRHQLLPELCQAYALKAMHVCHAWEPEGATNKEALSGDKSRPDPDIVRSTVKLPTDNWMSLRHAGFFSTVPAELKLDLRCWHYNLPEPGEPPESIAAEAFQCRRTIATNDYQAYPNRVQIFSDTECHISAPILTGRGRCHGILTIETTQPGAYSTAHQAALTLLAAQMTGPLQQALQRSALQNKLEEIRAGGERIRAAAEGDLLDTLALVLHKLGYARGMISHVSYRTSDRQPEKVVGTKSWGDGLIQEIQNHTRRHFADVKQRDDCQILAVQRGQEQLIRHPYGDERTKELATTFKNKNLQPFGVFPLLDNHRRAVWTIHVERGDQSPLGQLDVRWIKDLCGRVMKAWEEERRASLERQWLEKTVLNQWYSDYKGLLKQVADFFVENDLAVRCRVYLVEKGNQIPFYEGGMRKTPGFHDVKLGEDDKHILDKPNPVLFVRRNRKTLLKSGQEFEVLLDQEEAHPELNNERRSQWVEVPVQAGNRIVAKLVLDHTDAPEDAFTLGEMRLLSRFKRHLSIATEIIPQRARNHLCCLGLHASLLFHHLGNAIDRISHCPKNASLEELRERIKVTGDFFGRFEGLFRRGPAKASQEPRRLISVTEELIEAHNILRPLLLSNLNDLDLTFPTDHYPYPVPYVERPLLLIILSLAMNAQEAILRARERDTAHPAHIAVEVQRTPDGLCLRLQDSGEGMNESQETELVEKMHFPAIALAREEGSGLVYSAWLAQENGWKLQLLPGRKPTTFELQISIQDTGGEMMKEMTTSIWMLDGNAELLDDLKRSIQGRHSNIAVETFTTPESARKRLESLSPVSDETPRILITDWIGVDFASRAREKLPLLMNLLHSRQADDHPEDVIRYCQSRLFQEFVHKSESGRFMHTVDRWTARLQQTFVQKLRDYILACGAKKAAEPFLPDGSGSCLTLLDLYREIVRESPLGQAAEKILGKVIMARADASGA